MPAVALTDLGQMFGLWKFHRLATARGLKPILGVETFVAPEGRKSRPDHEPGSLLLLAQDLTGYRNLTRLTARANTEGFFHLPRVDLELLKEYSQGIVALSGGLSGEIPRKLLAGDGPRARELAENYARIFPGRFYLELWGTGLSAQNDANGALASLAKTLGLPLAAASECHYLNKGDRAVFEVLQRVRTRGVLDYDRARDSQAPGAFHFKSPAELREIFRDYPEALDGTARIAESCLVEFPERRAFSIPRPDIGEKVFASEDFAAKADDYFLKLAREGLEKILQKLAENPATADPDLAAIYQSRLRKEIGDILALGASAYFLTVADFVKTAKARDILIGPGRAAAASSLVNYVLGITDIDPIQHGLVFEHFLNSSGRDFPSIDIEAPLEKADDIIAYLMETYGGSHFSAHCLRLNLLRGRSLVREVGRAFGLPLSALDEICRMLPTHLRISIQMAMDEISLIKKAIKKDPMLKKVLDIAAILENIPRAAEAAPHSLVVSPRLLRDSIPVFLDYNSMAGPLTVVQYDRDGVEENGLLCFDVIPSKTLSLMSATLKLLGPQRDRVELSAIPLDDPETLKLLASGNFAGVFFLENPWVASYLERLPQNPLGFQDLVHLLAIHPPLRQESALREDYLAARNLGKRERLHPDLDAILDGSHGLWLFQEQLVELAQKATLSSLEEAELLLRKLIKNDPGELALTRPVFLARAEANGFTRETGDLLWSKLLANAPFAPTKAEAVSGALTCFRTAYLKAHYPREFMDAFLRSAEVNRDKQEKALKEWRAAHFRLIPPPGTSG
jgi:DNA polymerase-3 subunit alpha